MKRKRITVVMAMMMTCVAIAGCGKQSISPSAVNDSKENIDSEQIVTIDFAYIVSGTMSEQDLINQALSELAEKEIGMKVNVIALTYADALNQIPLMLAGGNDLDIFPAWSNQMGNFIDSGYIEDLNKHVEVMSNINEYIAEDERNCMTIKDVWWGVQCQKEQATCEAIFMRKDILDELSIAGETVKTYEDITDVFAQVKKAYPEMTVLGGASYESIADMGDVAIGCDTLGDELGVLANYGAKPIVVNEFETDSWKEAVDVTRKWYEAGYISQDMATSSDTGETMIAGGNTFAFANNWKPDSATEKFSTTGYKLVPVLISEPMTNTQMGGGTGFSVNSSSKHPKEAVEFLDWIYGSGEANDLLNWGIEGAHWIEDVNGTAGYPEGVTAESCGYHNGWGFIVPNQFAGHLWEGNPTDLYEQYREYKENAHKSVAYGFSFDSANVTNEIVACQTVLDQYIATICTGAADSDSAIKEMNDALYKAGIQTIIDEKQSQLDDFLDNK